LEVNAVDFLYQILTEGWKLWLIVGIMFFFAEGVNPGTFALFFGGLGALVTAAACYLFPGVTQNGTWQLLIFAAMSLASLFLLRPRITRLNQRGPNLDDYVASGYAALGYAAFLGKQAKTLTALHKNSLETGRILFEGTEWSAVLSDGSPDEVPAGTVVEIVKMEGLTAWVRCVGRE